MTEHPYKLAHIDKTQVLSAGRKALIAADTHYYARSVEEQERFRATMNEDARLKIQSVLLSALCNIKCSVKDVTDSWSDITQPDLNKLNWARLLTTGIGEDYIHLNECMAEDETLLDFPTLYDYDYADYLFQEQARKQSFSDYKGMEYYAYRHTSWVRLLIQEQFYYASFFSLATYVINEVESEGNELIKQLIPHDYVDGKSHGKPEDDGFVWDIEIDAGGQEAQLEELKDPWRVYQQERWVALCEQNQHLEPHVYTQDQDGDGDPQRYFIFVNAATLKQIRWRRFLSDCEPLTADFSEVETYKKNEIERAKSWLAENHQDVLDNMDASIIKFHKKRKVIMSADALDDLSKIDDN